MDRAQAAREARSLAAEWIDMFRRTETGRGSWEDVYTPEDLARVNAELDRVWERLASAGPSLFHRLARQRKERQAP
jgi:hypothetical protein